VASHGPLRFADQAASTLGMRTLIPAPSPAEQEKGDHCGHPYLRRVRAPMPVLRATRHGNEPAMVEGHPGLRTPASPTREARLRNKYEHALCRPWETNVPTRHHGTIPNLGHVMRQEFDRLDLW
jgi:hypothetical protein